MGGLALVRRIFFSHSAHPFAEGGLLLSCSSAAPSLALLSLRHAARGGGGCCSLCSPAHVPHLEPLSHRAPTASGGAGVG
jgi:hypothetical protein